MAQADSFSLLQVIATSSATFITSGIGGALFQKWLTRSKPSISITSVGFEVPEELIRLPESLQIRSDENAWVRKFKNYEESEDLLKFHEEAQTITEQLRNALELAQTWLQENEGKDISSAIALAELKKHPYFEDVIIGSLILGGIKRAEISNPPVVLEQASEVYEDLFETKEMDEMISIDLGKKRVQFSFDNMFSKQKMQVETLAKSFAKGIYGNLAYYTKEFIAGANRDINRLQQLSKELESVLLPRLRLSIGLSVYNSGKSSTVLYPYVGLKILDQAFEDRSFLLAIKRVQKPGAFEIKNLFPMLKERGERGKDIVVSGLLPETSTSPYIDIPPEKFKELKLVATEPIGGDDISIVKEIYSTGLLTCQVVYSRRLRY
ncbi:hypothetical protein HRE53_08225 [Acaryochloris sp. 'Moss Beach']|uniref:hypothetical protein n=1 Tax=Acaryochloris sp. 'Moss Beach' TaxID=2740837 RepID=UPI001F2F5AF9|nr:hypothetical protein [Acaryochloris sp. 'Moss Beach']UJB70999.1 hypothetical protein HRE53_08225 [Acaryochloris sp. 'Moss Beach']